MKTITLKEIYEYLKNKRGGRVILTKTYESEYGEDIETFTFTLRNETITCEKEFSCFMNPELNYDDIDEYDIIDGNKAQYEIFIVDDNFDEITDIEIKPLEEITFEYDEISYPDDDMIF